MLRKLPYETAAPILERFKLTEEADGIVSADMSPQAVLERLHDAGLLVD